MSSLRTIFWDKEARNYLKEAISYIRKDSPQNADLVKERILSSIRQLCENPYRHPADKFRRNNDGSYRAYEITRFRIAYHVSQEAIYILRIRHVSMEPKDY